MRKLNGKPLACFALRVAILTVCTATVIVSALGLAVVCAAGLFHLGKGPLGLHVDLVGVTPVGLAFAFVCALGDALADRLERFAEWLGERFKDCRVWSGGSA